MSKLVVQLVGAARYEIIVSKEPTVGELKDAVSLACDRPANTIKIVHKGATLSSDDSAKVKVADGDVLLAMPQRKAPAQRMVSAVVGQKEEEDEELPAQLPPGAPRWEVALVENMRRRGKVPPWVMEWVVLIRPLRLLALMLFMAGCVITSRLGLGPVFVLASIIFAIFHNLGKRGEGEASAYSIFNPQVRRLPGQLDADQVDRQIRAGQM
mmetsp:Transcript_26501/g.57820  ORF Transcript_26501/g.57820 Transcript_26501/m.57820 type:complete len:211 (+) Transcript_26501:102-734(+)